MGRRKQKPLKAHIIRYHLADGSRCTSTTPGAIKTTTVSESWYWPYTDDDGKRKLYPLGTTDLGEAYQYANEFEIARERRRRGIEDQFTDAAQLTLASLVDDWLASIHGRSRQHVAELRARITRLIALAGWRRCTDLTADSLLRTLSRLNKAHTRRTTTTTPRPVSATTRNHYLGTARQFAAWLCQHPAKLQRDPFVGLKPINPATDRRHRRRCPTAGEIEKLFAHLEADTRAGRRGLPPRARAMLYKVAMGTGLRAAEIRSLTPASWDWQRNTVTVQAGYSKHRKQDVVPLPDWLVAELTAYFADGGPLWGQLGKMDPVKCLQGDLKRAGIPYRVEGTAGPEVFDFHALRVWYITSIASQPGVSPKTLMDLCRHSTARISLEIYTKTRINDLREAVANIPAPGIPAPKKPGRKKK